jgi:tetrapyrrole methylase family protein/MazG family protein
MQEDTGNENLFAPEKIDGISSPPELFSILLLVMAKLRGDNGCMWDREQTHESIKRNLVEEAYEAVDSIEEKDHQELKEELGDIMLQVVFHSSIAEDDGEFGITDVLRSIIKKLVRRHPHVFAGTIVQNSDEVLSNWEDIKRKERQDKSQLNGRQGQESDSMFSNIPRLLPALHFAYEIQNRAARLGFDWEGPQGVIEKIREEAFELEKELSQKENNRVPEEIGDMLFTIVNLSRHMDIDSEKALKDSCRKFIARFDYMEKYAIEKGLDFKSMKLSAKDALWDIAKKNCKHCVKNPEI